MNTLIVYGTKYGCTKYCVELLSTLLNHEATILSVKNMDIELEQFDTIIVGGSVYMGKTQKEIVNFLKHHKQVLLQKELGLFACCYTQKDTEGFFESLYPKELIDHAYYTTSFGGKLNYQKMNFLYRKMFQVLKTIDGFQKGFAEPEIDLEEINKLAEVTNHLSSRNSCS